MAFTFKLLLALLGCVISWILVAAGIAAIASREAYPLMMRYNPIVYGNVAVVVGLGWLVLALAVFGVTVLRPLPLIRGPATRSAVFGFIAFFAVEAIAILMQVAKVYFGFAL